MKRILFYVHFNKNNSLSNHVVYQLRNMGTLFDTVVFISNSRVSISDKKELDGLCDDFIQRENTGFDFAAWRDGMQSVGWLALEKYDSVTIMNDTCFGPVYPIHDMYDHMEAKKVDFWGVTDHAATTEGMPGTGGPVPHHIQSYLEVFNKRTVKSAAFQSFWDGVVDHSDVHRVIQDYETQLATILSDAGFSHDVFFRTIPYSKAHNITDFQNYSEFKPIILLNNKVPLVKIKSFLHTPKKDIVKELNRAGYPSSIALEHLHDVDVHGIEKKSAGADIFEKSVRKGVGMLRRSNTVRRIAKKNPKLVVLAKKTSKKVLGGAPIAPNATVEPERNKEISFWEGYNADLAMNYAEHNNILQSNKVYYYENESKEFFVRGKNDPRIVAVYLPQYHPFKENDDAWGKGFTEWTNVTASTPRFVGQQQPVLPSDLGYYDLRTPGVIEQQINLAKKYGIYGFQFYYYWFSGKKVMNMPIETVLKNKKWDFNFSICWANENWTRKWDGGDNDIIFEQKNNKDDPLKFIEDVAPILNDDRYIQENGKPILTVYRTDLLDDPQRYAEIWRQYFKEKYNKELWLVGCTNFKNFDPKEIGFDATMDLTPTSSSNPELKPWVDDRKYLTDTYAHKLLDNRWAGHILDYRFIASQEIKHTADNINYYKNISPSWSNEARRKGIGGVTFQNSSPEVFSNWLDKTLEYETKQKKSPLVLINAWNEWAEAAMLEPSTHLGHNTLLRVAEVAAKYSSLSENKDAFPMFGMKYDKSAKLAVIVHLFYPDMWGSISEKLKNIKTPFDLYVSMPTTTALADIESVSQYHKHTNIITVPNRGRDVLPFLMIATRLRATDNYEYILKLHTKKSLHRKDGSVWFDDLLAKLLPDVTDNIINTLHNTDTGIIGPSGHLVSLSRHMGSNKTNIDKLISKLSASNRKYTKESTKYPFIGSTMFWARLDLLDPILDMYLVPGDFDSEMGQVDGTLAHAVERILGGILHDISAKYMYTVGETGMPEKVEDGDYDDKYKFAS